MQNQAQNRQRVYFARGFCIRSKSITIRASSSRSCIAEPNPKPTKGLLRPRIGWPLRLHPTCPRRVQLETLRGRGNMDGKLALVRIIPNQILFSFSSDKDRRTDSCRRGWAVFFRLIRLSVLLSLSELKEKRTWARWMAQHYFCRAHDKFIGHCKRGKRKERKARARLKKTLAKMKKSCQMLERSFLLPPQGSFLLFLFLVSPFRLLYGQLSSIVTKSRRPSWTLTLISWKPGWVYATQKRLLVVQKVTIICAPSAAVKCFVDFVTFLSFCLLILRSPNIVRKTVSTTL